MCYTAIPGCTGLQAIREPYVPSKSVASAGDEPQKKKPLKNVLVLFKGDAPETKRFDRMFVDTAVYQPQFIGGSLKEAPKQSADKNRRDRIRSVRALNARQHERVTDHVRDGATIRRMAA